MQSLQTLYTKCFKWNNPALENDESSFIGAHAFLVKGDAMYPRYFREELAVIHPHRMPAENRDAIIQMKSGDIFIRRFLKESTDEIYVKQFNPDKDYPISKSHIKALYAVAYRKYDKADLTPTQEIIGDVY